MRHLLAATCLTPAILCLSTLPLRAQTVIGNAQTSPVRTSTVKAGAPDSIRISSGGSLKPTGGVAVTIDSNHSVTNEGTIQITGANDATGIHANAGNAGTITNSGKIILDETYTPTDTDKDGDIDGPFAQGSGRYGIRVGSGGVFTGNIVNSGTITIEGNDSAGIRLDGGLAGNLTNSGTIEVIGNNSYGVRTQDVSGNVTVNGTVTSVGAGSVGVALDGDVGGGLVIQGTVASTGYRSVTAPADTSKLDADDLLQGGPAVRVAGDVAGGILFDAPPPNNSTTDDDEDDDGVKDASETTATIRSYGAAPAVQIGAATGNVTIGAISGNASGHGIVNRGTIIGVGVYNGVAANGLVIGGLGGAVTVAGGLTNARTIAAESVGAAATAVRVGAGASVPVITNSGTIAATGGGTTASPVQAILIEAGGNVGTIRNSGTISAAASGAQGTAGAIVDRSGTLTLVENSGVIKALGAPAGSEGAIAIDLRANTTGAIVRQTAPAQGAAAGQIIGNIVFGSGDDLLDVAGGTVAGNTSFGLGADRLNLGGSAIYTGNVDFGGGADTLALAGTSRFVGQLAGSGGLAVTVNGGSLALTNSGTVALSSLSLAGQGSLAINIAPGTHTLYNIAGQASFAEGSKLLVNMASTADAEGDYVFLRAGSLAGGSNLALGSAMLPFLYVGSVTANQAAGEIALNIRRKTSTEMGLNRSESSAYAAVYDALTQDDDVESVFLNVTDSDQFRTAMRQMLPNHAGGAFENVTQASRATARFLSDPRAPMVDMGGWGFFLQQVAWGTSKDLGDTAAYDISGWGATAGAEIRAGNIGAFGLSLSYLLGEDADGTTDNEVGTTQFEGAAYWRANWGALNAFARASIARINFDAVRLFSGSVGGDAVSRRAEGDWSGTLWSAGGGLSYEFRSGRLTVRPLATVDYYSLSEGDYSETGGGDGFNLIVDSRSSDELAASGTLTLGYDLGGTAPNGGFFRVELEGGRRQIVGGSIGATRARFADGDDFVLLPDERESGWLGRFRLLGGSEAFRVGGELSAEEQDGRAAVAFRLSLHSAF